MDARLDRSKAAFDALGHELNGYLEAEDFDRLGHRIIEALDVAESSPKAQALHAGRTAPGGPGHADVPARLAARLHRPPGSPRGCCSTFPTPQSVPSSRRWTG